MKSLKRTLCLVLALVMVLGLFGIASATDFTDDNDIQYKEAVEVVTGIGAIKGMGDGTFQPKGTITRAQAAVMVARVALTAGTVDSLSGTASNFTDVTVAGGYGWAIPSIEYLVGKGVINGMGDGTFNPNGEINGYAVLKMLLCVLGYGAKDEYVGTGWDLQVLIDANKAGLTAGRVPTASAFSAPSTREEVALYCYNALGAEVVEYNRVYDMYNKNQTGSAYDTKKQLTLGDQVYGLLQVEEGLLTVNGTIDTDAAKEGTTTVNSITYTIKTDLDLVGHWVKVYYRAEVGAEKYPVAYAVVEDTTKVVTVSAKDAITADGTDQGNGGANAKWAKIFKTATVDTTNVVGFDSDRNSMNATAVNTAVAVNANSTLTKAPAGTYILDDNKIICYIAPAAYTTGVVTEYKAPTDTVDGKIYINGADTTLPKTGEASSVSVYANPAVKDIVMKQTTGGFTTITKATPVAMGKVTAVDTKSAQNTLVMNGTTYAKSNVPGGFFGGVSPLAAWDNTLVNKTCALYADAIGNIIAVAVIEDSADSNLAFVVNKYVERATSSYGKTIYLEKIQCLDMTGKEVNYVLGASAGTEEKATEAYAFTGQIVSVSTSLNETLGIETATVVAASDLDTQGKTTFAKAEINAAVTQPNATISAGNYYAADTQFFFVTGVGSTLKVASLTGAQAIAGSTVYAYYSTKAETDPSYTVKYVFVKDESPAADGAGLVYIPNGVNFTASTVTESYTNDKGKDAKAIVNYAYIDGVYTKILCDSADQAIPSTEGFYTYQKNAQGIYKLTPASAYTQKKAGDADANAEYVTSVYDSADKKLISTGVFTSASSVYGAADLTDVDASKVVVVDPVYAAKVAAGIVTSDDVNHTTLASLKDCRVAYAYKTADSTKSIAAIYYVGGPLERLSVSLAKDAGWTDMEVDTAKGGALSWKVDTQTAAGKIKANCTTTGVTYAWEIIGAPDADSKGDPSVSADNIIFAPDKTAAAGKITGAGEYVVKCTVTKAGSLAGEATFSFTIVVNPAPEN